MTQMFLSLAGIVSLGVGIWVMTLIKSDVQVVIVAVCLIGGVLMIGQASILDELAELRGKKTKS